MTLHHNPGCATLSMWLLSVRLPLAVRLLAATLLSRVTDKEETEKKEQKIQSSESRSLKIVLMSLTVIAPYRQQLAWRSSMCSKVGKCALFDLPNEVGNLVIPY